MSQLQLLEGIRGEITSREFHAEQPSFTSLVGLKKSVKKGKINKYKSPQCPLCPGFTDGSSLCLWMLGAGAETRVGSDGGGGQVTVTVFLK